ncbi:MAG: OmpA family protein [Rhizomicrobium sp.]
MKIPASRFLISALAVALCGCGGPRPILEAPLPLPARARPAPSKLPPLRNAARIPAKPLPPPPVVTPLTVARVGSYMDELEGELRRHVHGGAIARQGDNITLVIPNSILFPDDGGVAGDNVLGPLAAILRNHPHIRIAVNGYTDTPGTAQQNLAVSQKRAQLVADALARRGAAAGRITATGFGETHLRVATGDDRKEPRNRRIEIALRPAPG